MARRQAFGRDGRWWIPVSALAALLLAAPGAHAQPFSMTDSLRGGSTGGSAVGGAFGPDGWTVTSRTDRLWWALPRLVEGSVEFTVTGMSNANLDLEDMEIFTMYEAGYGITEPIRYDPEYRNNHYKVMLRIYGQATPERIGQQKLMFGMCPSGAPGYDACGCESFFGEPFGGDGTWDGSAQVLRIEWGGGTTRLLRNGSEVVSIDWSASGLAFGPDTLHMSLGSARTDAVATAGMPIGAVFSDVRVDGLEGPLAVCPGTADADADGDGDAAGDAIVEDDSGADGPDDPGAEGETGADADARADGDASTSACQAVACHQACTTMGFGDGTCHGDLCVCAGGGSGDGGCGCAIPGRGFDGPGVPFALFGLWWIFRERRRRS